MEQLLRVKQLFSKVILVGHKAMLRWIEVVTLMKAYETSSVNIAM